MESLVVGEDNLIYGRKGSTDEKIMSRLSVGGSKKTPLCYSKVNPKMDMRGVRTPDKFKRL